ncbi:hypothetical protein [Kitasatospora sp. NPDC088351]|uniref:hypothetical protein n=1 Tax=unclassified Kitasatospora TaxID=2633591 RepID=UPI003444BAAA
MADLTTPALRVRSKIARSVAIAGLAVAAAVAAAPAATASGTSGQTNGCYSTWGSTGSNAHCKSVGVTGYYRNHAECSWQSDRWSTYYYFWNLSSQPNWGQVDCAFSIESSWVDYTTGP